MLDAGLLALTSREAYVVVRPEHGVWLAWLGLGSHLLAVSNPEGGRRDREGKLATRRGRGGARVVKGAKSFASRENALSAATAAWGRNLEERIACITRARGGTLAWGRPLAPLAEPIVIELGVHGSAWDVAVALPRRSPEGDAMLSGTRPSGECALTLSSAGRTIRLARELSDPERRDFASALSRALAGWRGALR